MMSFWNGYVLGDFIFKGFNTKTPEGFAGAFIALVSVGILYEGLYLMKKELLEKFLAIRRQLRRHPQSPPLEGGSGDSEDVNINPRNSLINDETFSELDENPRISSTSSQEMAQSQCAHQNEFSYLFLSSLLHVCYVFLGYTLMNAVMTFNIWVLVATCLGLGIGYFFFRHDSSTLKTSYNGDYDFQQNSIEAYAQLHENDKTDQAHTHSGDRDGAEASNSNTNQSPSGSARVRNATTHTSKVREEKEAGAAAAAAAQVIVVGAQVHNYQQSVE